MDDMDFGDVLRLLDDWKGRDIAAFLSGDGGYVHPVAAIYGVLGGVKMSSVKEYEEVKGVAAYRVGAESGFAIDQEAFEQAWITIGRLFVRSGGTMLQIEPDGVRLPWGDVEDER